MCYSVAVTTLDQYRQAAGYVDRILSLPLFFLLD
jgi:hypothetical protein